MIRPNIWQSRISGTYSLSLQLPQLSQSIKSKELDIFHVPKLSFLRGMWTILLVIFYKTNKKNTHTKKIFFSHYEGLSYLDLIFIAPLWHEKHYKIALPFRWINVLLLICSYKMMKYCFSQCLVIPVTSHVFTELLLEVD